MSYYRVFDPTEDLIDEIKKEAKRYNSYTLNNTKIELGIYCLLNHSNEKISDVLIHLKSLLFSMEYDILSSCYKYALDRYEDDDDKQIWYCGWQYSHNEPETSKDDLIEYVLSNLTQFCCVVNTPDWFDDNEKFCEKKTEIDQLIEYYIDEMTIIGDYKIIDLLKICESPDSDNYNELQIDEESEDGLDDDSKNENDGFKVNSSTTSVSADKLNKFENSVTSAPVTLVYTCEKVDE